ncbi:MAG: response regulator [Acholeplasmataceae bacterium]|nr:response regulator [Acholeplasmataceae bacterium]
MTNNDQFQSIILKIATELVNINIDQFDEVIQNTLELVGDFLNVDRVYVFEYNHERRIASNTFEWCNKGVSSEIDNLQTASMDIFADDLVNHHLEGRNFILENVSSLDHDNPLYIALSKQGIKSLTTIPLMDDKHCLGFVGYDDVRVERKWNEKETSLLKVLAVIIANAMLKQKSQKLLIELKEKADQASLEKNQFLAKISHEFRTPLNGAKNALYLLNSTRLTSEQKEYVDIAAYSTEHLISMIGDILDISKIESGQIENFRDIFDLENELANILLGENTGAQEKGLSLSFDFDYSINHLFISDLKKLRQIITNLINNAIKYTNQGNVSLDVKKIKETSANETLVFTIKDTGIGIDQTHYERIYDKFYQVDSGNSRNYEGTGLGLAIVKELVEQLDGEIVLESQLEKGTEFRITLKLTKSTIYDFSKLNQIKVLIIDNDQESLKINDLLSSMHIKVETLKNITRKYDVIFFNQKKSLELIDYYKNNYGKSETLIAASYNGDMEIDKIDVLLNSITSRKLVYRKITAKLNGHKQEVKDIYSNELTGYALVVDDNRLNRIVLENILRKEGIKSKLVDSGFKAIEAVQKERFDIVLMDIQMPKMDGMETSNKIRGLGPQYKYLPIIAITANAFLNDYDLMKKAQMNDVLFKPINIEQLERILRNHISHQKYIFIPYHQIVFDRMDYENRFEGSMDIAIDIIKTFIDTYHNDLLRIHDAINGKNSKEIEQAIHYFKGSCAYLSGKRTTWLLSSMMDINIKNDIEHLKKACEVLTYEVDKLVEELKTYAKI